MEYLRFTLQRGGIFAALSAMARSSWPSMGFVIPWKII